VKTMPKKVHIVLEDDIYEQIWQIVKERYVSPVKKLHIIVNEALRQYIEKWRAEKSEKP